MNSNFRTSIDHLVIVSPTLETGVRYVYETLQVRMQKGGIHTKMGTHNALLKLGKTTYLEVIAVNPLLPKPVGARWFALDTLSISANPKLLTWVACTDDIKGATENSSIPFGTIQTMTRGALNWLITIPSGGGLPCDGIAPSLIQWNSKIHPASQLPEEGCSLLRMEGFHPDAEIINTTLQSIGFEGDFSVDPSENSSLVAYIQTPHGVRRFGG